MGGSAAVVSGDQADEVDRDEIQNDFEPTVEDLVQLVGVKVLVLRNEVMSHQIGDLHFHQVGLTQVSSETLVVVIRLEVVAEPEFRSLAIPDLDEMAAFAVTQSYLCALDAVLRVQNREEAQVLKVIIKVAGNELVSHISHEGLEWFALFLLVPLDFVLFDTAKL